MYYDEFTQPSISQKPKTPPPKSSTTMKPTAFAQATSKEPSRAAPLPATKSSAPGAPEMAKATAETHTLPIRANPVNVAEEAAKKAKEMRLQSLREKVHGTGRKSEPSKEKIEEEEDDDESDDDDTGSEEASDEDSDDYSEEASDEDEKPQSSSSAPRPGMSLHTIMGHASSSVQSPTSGALKNRRKSSGGSSASEEIRAMLESSKSSSWKPTDVEKPATSFAGAVVVPEPSEKQIAAIEKAETIVEEPEPDDEDIKKKAKKSDEKKSSRGKEKSSDGKEKKKKREKKDKKEKKERESSDKKDKFKKEKDKDKVKSSKSKSEHKDKDRLKKKAAEGKDSTASKSK